MIDKYSEEKYEDFDILIEKLKEIFSGNNVSGSFIQVVSEEDKGFDDIQRFPEHKTNLRTG